jgi:monoamine oxidase
MADRGPYKRSLKYDSPFSFNELFAHPGDLRAYDHIGPRKNVCVVGAGVAGLSTAYELEACGHNVIMLESTDRAGGRIRTHRFSDGSRGELGAMRIPGNHACTFHYVKKFGLKYRRFINQNPEALYYLRGVRTQIQNWSRLLSAYELRESERQDPLIVYEEQMKRAMAFITSNEKWQIFDRLEGSGRLLAYDSHSLRQHLRRNLSQEGMEYVGHASGLIQYEHASFLETLVDYFGLFGVDKYELVDGMDALTESFVRELQAKIRFSSQVIAIDSKGRSVSVTWVSPDGQHSESFDYVVCTVPAPAMIRIAFTPSLSYAKQQALRVTYASSAKTLVLCNSRYWEHNDGIFGGGSFTDLPIQQCWYPSDNAEPDREAGVLATYTGDDEANYAEAPLHWKARSVDVSHAPGVFTGHYTWTANADRFTSLTDSERTDQVLQNLELLHPGIGKHVLELKHFSWNEQSSPGSGAFAYFAPGEHARYQSALCEPHPAVAPRVFFAGEHLSVAHAWIQGAIQTGLAAAIDVLEAPVTSE